MLQNFLNATKELITPKKHTLSTTGANIWNQLDQYYKEINSYNTFKIQIKNHYLLTSNL